MSVGINEASKLIAQSKELLLKFAEQEGKEYDGFLIKICSMLDSALDKLTMEN